MKKILVIEDDVDIHNFIKKINEFFVIEIINKYFEGLLMAFKFEKYTKNVSRSNKTFKRNV